MLSPSVQITTANHAGEGTKKENFTECEIEVFVTEVEARKHILFDGLSSGISNKRNVSTSADRELPEEHGQLRRRVSTAGGADLAASSLMLCWSHRDRL